MGLFEKQIPKYIRNLEGDVVVEPTRIDASLIPNLKVDDIFDPLFNADVRARLSQEYGNSPLATFAGYNELLNNIWTENDGTFGKGMGLLSAFGRSMEKADDLVLGAATEAVKGVSGQGFENPIENIFVEDEDYTGRRFLAAAANSMRGFADGTTVTEDDFGAAWTLPSLGIELGTDVGILGSGLSKALTPHFTEAAAAGKRISSGEILRNLGKSGNAATTIGEVGQLLSDYDDLMTRVAIDVTAPGLRPAFKQLLGKIASMLGASSYYNYEDYIIGDTSPSNTMPMGGDATDVSGLTTLYKNAKAAMDTIPETADEIIERQGRSLDQISEEVIADTEMHAVERALAQQAEIDEVIAEDIARGEYNGTFSGARGDMDDIADTFEQSASEAAHGAEVPETSPTATDVWNVRNAIGRNLGKGRTITDAFIRRTNKPYKKVTSARTEFQANKLKAFTEMLNRAAEKGYPIDIGAEGFENYTDPDVQKVVSIIEQYVHPHTEWNASDAPLDKLKPYLVNIRKKLIKANAEHVPVSPYTLPKQKFPGEEIFRKWDSSLDPRILTENDIALFNKWAKQKSRRKTYLSDVANYIREKHKALLDDYRAKHPEVSIPKQDWESAPRLTPRDVPSFNAWITPGVEPITSEQAPGIGFRVNYKGISDKWNDDDWREFARIIYDSEYDFQSPKSFLEGFESQRSTPFYRKSTHRWHVSPSELALMNSDDMRLAMSAAHSQLDALRFTIDPSGMRSTEGSALKPIFKDEKEFDAYFNTDHMTTVLHNLFNLKGERDVLARPMSSYEDMQKAEQNISRFKKLLKNALFPKEPTHFFSDLTDLVEFVDNHSITELPEEVYAKLYKAAPEEVAYIGYVDSVLDNIGTEFVSRVKGWGAYSGSKEAMEFLPAERAARASFRYPNPDAEFMRDDFSDTADAYIKHALAKLGQTDIPYEDLESVIEPLKPYMQFKINHGTNLSNTKYAAWATDFISDQLPFVEELMRRGGNPFVNYSPKEISEEKFDAFRSALGLDIPIDEISDQQYANRKMLEYLLGNRKDSYTLAETSSPLTIDALRRQKFPLTPQPKRPVPVTYRVKGDYIDLGTDTANAFKVATPSEFEYMFQDLYNTLNVRTFKAMDTEGTGGLPGWETFADSSISEAKHELQRAIANTGFDEKRIQELLDSFGDPKLRAKMSDQEIRAVHYYTQVFNDVLGNIPYHIIKSDARVLQQDPRLFLEGFIREVLQKRTLKLSKHERTRLHALLEAHYSDKLEGALSPHIYAKNLSLVKRVVDAMPPQLQKAWKPSATRGLFYFDVTPAQTPYVIRLGETLPFFGYDSQIYQRYGMTAAQALTSPNPTKYGRYMGYLDYRKMFDTDLQGVSFAESLAEVAANAAFRMDFQKGSGFTRIPAEAVFNDLRKKHLLKKAKRKSKTVVSDLKPSAPLTPITRRSDVPKDAISRFRDEFKFLSNFYEAPVTFKGLTYRNAEAAFQAQKSPEHSKTFERLTGSDARRLGRMVPLAADWESSKLSLMEQIVKAKFEQNPDLMAQLLSTGDRRIVELNDWKDDYWGISSAEGQNHLGRILEQIRHDARMSQVSEPVLETSEAVSEIVTRTVEQPVSAIVEQITVPEAASVAAERVYTAINELCPDIVKAIDAGLTVAQAKPVNEYQWRLFKQISDAKSVAPRNATGDYATARSVQAQRVERELMDFVKKPSNRNLDFRQYYQLKARQAGDVLPGTQFWNELAESGMLTTCFPKGDKRITQLEYALRRNANKINDILGDEYLEVVVHNTVHASPEARNLRLKVLKRSDRPTVNVTLRFKKGMHDVVSEIQKHLRELDNAEFEDIVFAVPEQLSKENLAYLQQSAFQELERIEREGNSVAQDFYRMLGFTFDNADTYSRHAMNFDDNTMLFLQNNFYGQMPSEELDDIVDNIANVRNSKGAFGTRLSSRRFRGHYWNLEYYAPELFSYSPVKRFKSSITGGALANNQFQTYVDLMHNGNFTIREYFKTPEDLKKVLYAAGPSGKSGNFNNLELVTFKVNENGRVIGLHRFDKSTDKGLQQALDDPNTILVPTSTIAHIDKLFKNERRMGNKFWVFVNKYFTMPFKLGVLMNPGFLIGNLSDASMKTATAMAQKYGTTVSEEAARFADSLTECVNLKNSFYQAFEEFITATKEAEFTLNPSETIPDIAAMSPKHRKNLYAWLTGNLTHPVTEVLPDGKVQTVDQIIPCDLDPEIISRASFWMSLQTLQMDTSKTRELAELAGIVKKSPYTPKAEGAARIVEILVDNPLTKTVMDASEWSESTVRTAMLYNDLKHRGYVPGQNAPKVDYFTQDTVTMDALNTMYSAHFDYENTPDFMNAIGDAVPFPIFFLKNFYFWMELFINNPQFVDNVIDVQEGLWEHRRDRDEDNEFAKGAKGRGAAPVGDGDLTGWFKGFYKPTPLQSMFGAFSLLNDPINDLQYRLHPAITGAAAIAHQQAPTDLTTLLNPDENLKYRPYSTNPYERNVSPEDPNYNALEFAIHRANPLERATNTYLRTPSKVRNGSAQLSDFLPSVFQPEF